MVMPQIDPKKMAQVQQISQFIAGKITVNYKESTILIALNTDNADAQVLVNTLLDQFSGSLATQLSSFFSIKGEIEEIGKPES